MRNLETSINLKVMFLDWPDGVGDYRPRSGYFLQHIGVGAASPEATGDLGYLWRAAPDVHPAQPRCSFVGEVGWGWHYNQLLNSRTLVSDMQIKVVHQYILCTSCMSMCTLCPCATKSHCA
uniref:Uncharacterized protein n=1 Tax=Gouania willdenowi TaxID=441366 RepID=A0A8C5E3Q3_GOUWI